MSRPRILIKPIVLLLVAILLTSVLFHGHGLWVSEETKQPLLNRSGYTVYSVPQELFRRYSNLQGVMLLPPSYKSSPHQIPTTTTTTTTIPSSSSKQQAQPLTIFRAPVTPSDIYDRFHSKTRDSCTSECNSSRCAENNLPKARTREHWVDALEQGTIKGKPLFKSYEYVFPWEKDYLSKLPLKNVNELPDLRLSRVLFLPGQERPLNLRKVSCKRFETLSFRVDLVNRYGVQRPLGGDELRVWIEEDPSTRSGKRHSSSGLVRDLGNGSYIVSVTPTWPGLTRLNIGVVYPREYIRAALHQARIGSHRFNFGLFKRGDTEEVTLCHSTPNVPGRPCVCDFSSWNTVSFYCGRPLDQRLSCDDWMSVWPADHPPFKVLTSAETHLASRMSRPASETVIKHGILLNVTENKDKCPVLQPCNTTDIPRTWEKQPPRGYWTKGPQWTSLICREPEMTSDWVQQCLRSTQVWLIGDSNIVRITIALCTLLKCTYIPHLTKWPDSLLGRNEENNISVIFRPNEHPLYLRNQWNSLYLNGGMRTYLRSVPSTGKHVIIIHYYLHLASSHLIVLHDRLINLRESLIELFRRNDEVVVGIRGPHISTVQWETNHMFGGDVLATFMIRMLHDVFRDLKHRVIFLDGWDMSIGIRNTQMHPSNSIPTAMLRTILAFKCS